MSNPTLHKYRNVRPLNDTSKVEAMLAILVEIPNEAQSGFWIRETRAGNVCIFRHAAFPGVVLEYAQGTKDDSVTTIYEDGPEFVTLQAIIDMRAELIAEIGRVLFAIPSTVTVRDEGREREVALVELGTAQLIDVLAHFTQSDIATL